MSRLASLVDSNDAILKESYIFTWYFVSLWNTDAKIIVLEKTKVSSVVDT